MNHRWFFCLATFAFASAMAQSATNLIPNPTLANHTVANDTPDSWNRGGWDDIATLTYPAAGPNGAIAVKVNLTVHNNGDSKWYFNNVAVAPNTGYSFSDAYNANVASIIVVQFTATNGALSYAQLATLPTTNGAWATTTQTVTTPANVAALTVFHLINTVGTLTTANYSLTLIDAGSTGFPTGLVSLTFDDGWQSHFNNAFPILKTGGLRSTFYIISNEMLGAAEVIFPSADNPLNATTTAKKVVWSQIYSDPTQHNFTFSDTYSATAPSTITIAYKPKTGAATSLVLGPLPAGTNATANFSFILPVLAPSMPMTITHQVTTGTLTAKDPLLTESGNYMDTNEVLTVQAAGNEIGDHTENHCRLGVIQSNPSDTSSCALSPQGSTSTSLEIGGARTALLSSGGTPVDTFAYPYGEGAGNATIEELVAGAGLIAARSIDVGYNTKTTDKYHLLTQSVGINVTSANVQAWVDYAIANKVWLILTFHQVETSAALLNAGKANEETYGTTTAILQSAVNYLKTQQTAGKVVVDTVHNIMNQYMQ